MAKAKRRGLGKGLEALIPNMLSMDIVEENVEEERIHMLPIERIYPNVNQPRKNFNKEGLEELSNSIKVHGIIQPIIAIHEGKGYMIIAGERRYRAARNIGLKEIPCIIKNYKPKQLLEVSLIENLQREDLNIIEEAKAYEYLIERYKVTQDQLSEALGKSRSHVANTLRLLRLDKRIIDFIIDGKISAGHGRAVVSIKSHSNQYKVAEKIIEQGLSVRQVERLVKELASDYKNQEEKSITPNKGKDKDIFLVEIEEKLKSLFGTKVNITKGAKKGKIEIEYYNEDDLDRILSLLQ